MYVVLDHTNHIFSESFSSGDGKDKDTDNKLAKLRRHASRVHFASNNFGPIHFVFILVHTSTSFSCIHQLDFFSGCHVGHHICHHVSHHISHLVHLHVSYHVHLHVGCHVSHRGGHRNVVSTLCEASETVTEWKSETLTFFLPMDGRTDGLE